MAIINNTATVRYSAGRAGADTAVSNVATAELIEEYALSATKTALNNGFVPGENITYILQVTNTGTEPVFSVTVSDDLGGATLPLTFLEGSARLNIDGAITQIIPTTTVPLVFALPNPLPVGEIATIIYVARATTALTDGVTEITNTATVTGNGGSTTGPVVTAEPTSATVELEEFASLSIVKTVSTAQITPGVPFSYFITLTNSGAVEATNVNVTDVLPENFTINSITSTSGGTVTTFDPADYTLDAGTNTLLLPAPGSARTITVPASTGGVSGTTTIEINGTIATT